MGEAVDQLFARIQLPSDFGIESVQDGIGGGELSSERVSVAFFPVCSA
jgi:hypothetical protein